MKVTIEIPEPLYRKAKILAIERGESLQDLFVSALQRELGQADKALAIEPTLDRPDLYELKAHWFDVLKRKRNATNVVTNAWVNKMRNVIGL